KKLFNEYRVVNVTSHTERRLKFIENLDNLFECAKSDQSNAIIEDLQFLEVQRRGVGCMGSSSSQPHVYNPKINLKKISRKRSNKESNYVKGQSGCYNKNDYIYSENSCLSDESHYTGSSENSAAILRLRLCDLKKVSNRATGSFLNLSHECKHPYFVFFSKVVIMK
ncbi:hypothetical protein A3Q56_08542, partial [Intoshia linei]